MRLPALCVFFAGSRVLADRALVATRVVVGARLASAHGLRVVGESPLGRAARCSTLSTPGGPFLRGV